VLGSTSVSDLATDQSIDSRYPPRQPSRFFRHPPIFLAIFRMEFPILAPDMNQNPDLENLPLDNAWPEIQAALAAHRNLVLVAEPGAGKTTRFPPHLLRSGLIAENLKILILEPRRLAARASAARIADEQNWALGREVGYQVRFENRSSADTSLLVLTEGLLAKRLQTDPELNDVGAVILDEFHERSQHTDLGLALLYELQQLARPDLRLIVMSATIDAKQVATYLGDCPIVKVPGRTFPVDIHHEKRPLALETGPSFLDQVARVATDVLQGRRARTGDVLVFLPGAREIRAVRERISQAALAAGFDCVELHGSLKLEDQDRAIRKSRDRGKIILATNIAETSLTIDGVGTVIDSGLARVVRIDAAGFERLNLSRISLASATQRSGRAGRQSAGICYRLWSRLDEGSFSSFETPELLRTDLSEALLTLLAQGVTEPDGFSWFEKPPREAINAALETLTDLGLRDRMTGALTKEGRFAGFLPLSARLARLMIEAIKVDQAVLGSQLCALLSEKDISSRAADLKRQAGIESDIVLRLHLLNERDSFAHIDRFAVANVRRVAQAIESSARRIHRHLLLPSRLQTATTDDDELALQLLLIAYPDRVSRRRKAKQPEALMVGGRGVGIAPFSAVETAELFICIDSSPPPPHALAGAKYDLQISLASLIERDWLERLFPNSVGRQDQVLFDPETLSVQKWTSLSYLDLPIESAHVSRPSSDEAFAILQAACEERWQTAFAQEASLAQLFSRINFLEENLFGSSKSEQFAAAKIGFLAEVCFNETRLSGVLAKPLAEIFQRHLPSEIAETLRSDAPTEILVPSGSRIRVQYPAGRAPFIEVRIQEIFGMLQSPKIASGRIAIVLHLLSPGFRPVQVTSDLNSFWRSGYEEVRKELRARYPKHSWPEDPFTAKPEAKGRRRF